MLILFLFRGVPFTRLLMLYDDEEETDDEDDMTNIKNTVSSMKEDKLSQYQSSHQIMNRMSP